MKTDKNSSYTVVARRYRPQLFSELVGQGHISTALSNAIKQNRVGHAYLFTGARGVGKTSSARIFAKCLNCVKGPTLEPCNQCDICEAVSVGEDIDVLEIDGASNRGIDEIRQLRSNAGVRPSRSRFKIYIIDEVHMLTPQAFNALLKTLEEPPPHVKFIFCTTDPQKIPITVLSRCQRFDFSPVQTGEIAKRLKEIADKEGVKAEEAALALLARRANGSMRDSQSLLEQLFSFCGDDITVEEVNQLLGTADISRIIEFATAMTRREAATCIEQVHKAMTDGIDAGQLARQLLGFYRDMMAIRVGCGADTLLNCSSTDMDVLKKLGDSLGLETILMIIQILDGAMVRMQSSVHTQTLLELALVRICNLEKMESISALVSVLSSGAQPIRSSKADASHPVSKKNEITESVATARSESPSETPVADSLSDSTVSPDHSPVRTSPEGQAAETTVPSADAIGSGPEVVSPPAAVSEPASEPEAIGEPNVKTETQPTTEKDVKLETTVDRGLDRTELKTLWEKALSELGDMTADMAREYEKLEICDTNKLVVTMKDAYNRDMCSRPERKTKLESTLTRIAGRLLRVDFLVSADTKNQQIVPMPKMTRGQQIRQLHERPWVKKVMEVFDADITDFRNPK